MDVAYWNDLVGFLLHKGLSRTTKRPDGVSPIQFVTINGFVETANFLLQRGVVG